METGPGNSYVAELARSGAAKCRLCETNIRKGELRVGKLIDGDWGLQTRWYHLHCVVIRADSLEAIDGSAELSAEHRTALQTRLEESRSEVDEEAVPVDPDAIVRTEWSTEANPPPELLMPLLPYQREGLAWLLHQERESAMAGGILADEMGMGKTIQAIALLLAHRRNPADEKLASAWAAADRRHGVEASKPRGGTLVVVPVVAMGQWQAEISRFTAPNSLSVKVFHGAGRADDPRALAEADVVLTSYKTLEAAYRKQSAGAKVECSVCGRKFYAEKLRVHRTYFCGEGARRTEAQARQQRKGRDRGSHTTREDLSDDSDADADEVDRQKRLIKEMKAQGGRKRASKGAKGRAKETEKSDESGEDEVDRQKRLIKEQKAQGGRKRASKGAKGRAKETEKSDESGEDDTQAQTLLPQKRQRTRNHSNSGESFSKSLRAETSGLGACIRVRHSRKAASSISSYKERSDDSESEEWTPHGQQRSIDSDSDDDSESSFETESSSDESLADSESSGVSKPTARNSSQKGNGIFGKTQIMIDEDVERDILAAQRKAPKAVASPLHKVFRIRSSFLQNDLIFFTDILASRRP